MLHDRIGLEYLTELMDQRGIRHLIISPGSRNAPIINALCKRKGMQCLSIVDERSAAFFALGMAQQLQQPVAIACTSGTAALNFAPAIAEAFYQRIPLLVLTADRPVEFIDQGDGQTIRQANVFSNYIRKSLQLPQTIKRTDDLWYANRLASEALNACLYPVPGPVHINLPFSEPLYGAIPEHSYVPKDYTVQPTTASLSHENLMELTALWNQFQHKMILVGQMVPDKELEKLLGILSLDPSVVVLTETTSNIFQKNVVSCIDKCLAAIGTDNTPYAPDLLISLGGSVVSKRIKSFLRNAPIRAHWHVDEGDLNMDTYQHLTRTIPMPARGFLSQFLPGLEHGRSTYAADWKVLSSRAQMAHNAFLEQCPWSDLQIFEKIMQAVPAHYNIQLGNSTPVRYSQLFEPRHDFRFDANRGTSGIDGGLSTAAGACMASGKPTLMITGDLGFFYDSNALWNKHLPKDLRIIMINNEGGGIFRFIEGPDTTGFLEEFFETRHQTSAMHIAKAFGVNYYHVNNAKDLAPSLEEFLRPGQRAAILEISSPPEMSAQTLREYFKALPNGGQAL